MNTACHLVSSLHAFRCHVAHIDFFIRPIVTNGRLALHVIGMVA